VARWTLYGLGAPDTVRWHTGKSSAPNQSTLGFFAPLNLIPNFNLLLVCVEPFWGVEVCSEHYSIFERDSAEAAMQDAARRVLSHYCSVFGGVANGLNLKYYPRLPSGSTGGVVVSPVGEDNPRLSSTVNLAAVLNTELDHALDELSRARAEIAQLRAERAERRHLEDGSPASVGTQHPYCSPQRGHHAYVTSTSGPR
jgi:hypothetical protein